MKMRYSSPSKSSIVKPPIIDPKDYKIPFKYKIDTKFKRKLDKLIKNLNKNDVWIIIDGDEGSGKTNTAGYILWYVHCVTGREFNQDRFYFDSDAMFEYIKDHKESLINWDEGALGGLSTEWWNKSQRNLIKFAMTGRKKHHFFVICIPKIFKLTEYLKVDRSHALVHMDLGKHLDNYGHFMYLTKRGKSKLCKQYQKNKLMTYGSCMRKYGGFGGRIPYIFNEILDEAKYEAMKDKAISEIGQKKVSKKDIKEQEKDVDRKKKVFLLTETMGVSINTLAKHFGVSSETIRRWGGRTSEVYSTAPAPNINSNGGGDDGSEKVD